MELKIKGYSISHKNYRKRTPEQIKFIADILLTSIIAMEGVFLTMPDFKGREWVKTGYVLFVIFFKLGTKLVTEMPKSDG